MKQTASPLRELIAVAWPMYIAQIATMINGVIDTIMAGRLSALDLAAVGIAASIQATVLMSLTGVLLALPPIVAKLYGAERHADIGRQIHQSLWIALVLGLIAILLLHYPGPFIALSQLQPAVEAKVRAYLDASAWGVPAVLLFRIFFGLFSGITQPQPVMRFNLAALALKLPLNAVFMYGLLGLPAMGSTGCALASTLDTWLIALAAWGWCLRKPRFARFELTRHLLTLPDWAAIGAFLGLGLPIALTFIADLTAFTLMALFIARLGPIASAAHQIASNLAVFAYMLPMALGSAAAVLAGKALGAGQPQWARETCWRGIGLGLALASAVSLTLWTCAPRVAALYSSDARVQAAALPLILLAAVYHLADALQTVAVNSLRGYQRTAIPMVIYTVGLWGLGLGGGVVLGLTDWLGPPRGAAGFWQAAVVSLALVGLLMALYLDQVSRAELAGVKPAGSA